MNTYHFGHIFKKMALPLVASLTALPTFAGPSEWFDANSNFATLDSGASQVRFSVQYPQLGGGNCGIGIALNGFNSHEYYYKQLLEHIDVKSIYLTDQGTYELLPTSVSRDGILYAFNYFNQYYMTFVTISTKDGSTFGEVFERLPTINNIHAITGAVTCQQLDDAKQN
ncbi:hypothetical protein HG263_16605 [Pseudoalteromonas sp. JBTF-M23]|uniref:Uncharacterized protein n=1 Tax=Pseudoalteromonas caenipelagi TaxID=2726988 RepID=A0A849VKB6_9GAMM|nr:hypothetical protein [Pseudoalteromonas caenipelagi]NOU52151.1 hypothetical protein [Pseudoalteromonas caenipelagi]